MRWIVRGDIDGFFGLALDNLVQLLLIDTLCRGVLGFPPELVYGRVLPAAAVSILVGNIAYAIQARRLAKRTGRHDVCALPYGINTVSLFAHVFLVMLPAKAIAEQAGAADPSMVAWQAGLLATLASGVIELAGAFVAERVRKATPRAALLSTLAGIALGFISLGFLFRTFAHPVIGLITLAVVMLTYFGRVRFKGHVPGGIVAVALGTIIAWWTGVAPIGARPEAAALHLPTPVIGDVLASLSGGHLVAYASVILAMGRSGRPVAPTTASGPGPRSRSATGSLTLPLSASASSKTTARATSRAGPALTRTGSSARRATIPTTGLRWTAGSSWATWVVSAPSTSASSATSNESPTGRAGAIRARTAGRFGRERGHNRARVAVGTFTAGPGPLPPLGCSTETRQRWLPYFFDGAPEAGRPRAASHPQGPPGPSAGSRGPPAENADLRAAAKAQAERGRGAETERPAERARTWEEAEGCCPATRWRGRLERRDRGRRIQPRPGLDPVAPTHAIFDLDVKVAGVTVSSHRSSTTLPHPVARLR